MKYLVPGLTTLMLCAQLLAVGQKSPSSSGKVPNKAPIHKKTTPAPPSAPVSEGLVVPSWLPAEAPLQPAATILTEVLDTKLDVRFDYKKQYLLGTAVLTLRSHFYPQSELTLDAKGFDIQKIELVGEKKNKTLNYNYNRRKIAITLDHPYPRNTPYQVRIVYVAKPMNCRKVGRLPSPTTKASILSTRWAVKKTSPAKSGRRARRKAAPAGFPL
jgi:aminopeptidase N